MYAATTRAIQVTVRPQYLPDQSDPDKSQFVWAYQVRIENKGDIAVQLRSRHWKITDGLGRLQEVKGPGVVGKTLTPEVVRAVDVDPGVHFLEVVEHARAIDRRRGPRAVGPAATRRRRR